MEDLFGSPVATGFSFNSAPSEVPPSRNALDDAFAALSMNSVSNAEIKPVTVSSAPSQELYAYDMNTDFSALPIAVVRKYLQSCGVDFKHCVEKKDIIALAKETAISRSAKHVPNASTPTSSTLGSRETSFLVNSLPNAFQVTGFSSTVTNESVLKPHSYMSSKFRDDLSAPKNVEISSLPLNFIPKPVQGVRVPASVSGPHISEIPKSANIDIISLPYPLVTRRTFEVPVRADMSNEEILQAFVSAGKASLSYAAIKETNHSVLLSQRVTKAPKGANIPSVSIFPGRGIAAESSLSFSSLTGAVYVNTISIALSVDARMARVVIVEVSTYSPSSKDLSSNPDSFGPLVTSTSKRKKEDALSFLSSVGSGVTCVLTDAVPRHHPSYRSAAFAADDLSSLLDESALTSVNLTQDDVFGLSSSMSAVDPAATPLVRPELVGISPLLIGALPSDELEALDVPNLDPLVAAYGSRGPGLTTAASEPFAAYGEDGVDAGAGFSGVPAFSDYSSLLEPGSRPLPDWAVLRVALLRPDVVTQNDGAQNLKNASVTNKLSILASGGGFSAQEKDKEKDSLNLTGKSANDMLDMLSSPAATSSTHSASAGTKDGQNLKSIGSIEFSLDDVDSDDTVTACALVAAVRAQGVLADALWADAVRLAAVETAQARSESATAVERMERPHADRTLSLHADYIATLRSAIRDRVERQHEPLLARLERRAAHDESLSALVLATLNHSSDSHGLDDSSNSTNNNIVVGGLSSVPLVTGSDLDPRSTRPLPRAHMDPTADANAAMALFPSLESGTVSGATLVDMAWVPVYRRAYFTTRRLQMAVWASAMILEREECLSARVRLLRKRRHSALRCALAFHRCLRQIHRIAVASVGSINRSSSTHPAAAVVKDPRLIPLRQAVSDTFSIADPPVLALGMAGAFGKPGDLVITPWDIIHFPSILGMRGTGVGLNMRNIIALVKNKTTTVGFANIAVCYFLNALMQPTGSTTSSSTSAAASSGSSIVTSEKETQSASIFSGLSSFLSGEKKEQQKKKEEEERIRKKIEDSNADFFNFSTTTNTNVSAAVMPADNGTKATAQVNKIDSAFGDLFAGMEISSENNSTPQMLSSGFDFFAGMDVMPGTSSPISPKKNDTISPSSVPLPPHMSTNKSVIHRTNALGLVDVEGVVDGIPPRDMFNYVANSGSSPITQMFITPTGISRDGLFVLLQFLRQLNSNPTSKSFDFYLPDSSTFVEDIPKELFMEELDIFDWVTERDGKEPYSKPVFPTKKEIIRLGKGVEF